MTDKAIPHTGLIWRVCGSLKHMTDKAIPHTGLIWRVCGSLKHMTGKAIPHTGPIWRVCGSLKYLKVVILQSYVKICNYYFISHLLAPEVIIYSSPYLKTPASLIAYSAHRNVALFAHMYLTTARAL